MPTPRSSYRLDPDLKHRLRARAKAEGISETDFVVRAIEAALNLDQIVTSSVKTSRLKATGPKKFSGPFPKTGRK